MLRRQFVTTVLPLGLAGVAVAQEAKQPDRLSGVVRSHDKEKKVIEMYMRKQQNVVRKIMYDDKTQFTMDGKAATAEAIKEQLRIVAIGKFDDVNLKATAVSLTTR